MNFIDIGPVLEEPPECPSLHDWNCAQLSGRTSLHVCTLCRKIGPFCGREISEKKLEFFRRFAPAYATAIVNTPVNVAVTSPAMVGWQTAKDSWNKAASFFSALKSRGFAATIGEVTGLAPGAGERVSDDIFKLRHLSCFGDQLSPPCRVLLRSEAGSFCGACGCGEKKLARLDEALEGGYTKLHYPKLQCPLKRPGFSNNGTSSHSKELEKYVGIYSDPKAYPRYGHTNHGKGAISFMERLRLNSLIDVGCGHNEFVKEMLLRNPSLRAVGVDFACPGADTNAPATALPFPDKSFDMLTAFDLLEHIPIEEIDLAISEFKRVSRSFVFSISYVPSVHKWKGQNLHPTVRPEGWWIAKISQSGGSNVQKSGRYITGNWNGSPVTLNPSSTCILVGNGPSVLESDSGRIIDAFDEVVRFNLYKLAGFENHTGSRTTIWSTFGKGTPLPVESGVHPKRVIFIHGEGQLSYSPEQLSRIPVPFFNELRARIKAATKKEGADKDRLIPSSGMLVLAWLMEVVGMNKVTLTGFDHFSKTRSGQHHYWVPKSFGRPKEHDGDAEAELISEFVKSGRVSYL